MSTDCNTNHNQSNVIFNYVKNTLPSTLYPFNIYFVLNTDGSITTYMTDRNANAYLISSRKHNDLEGIQGGQSGQYYHLTAEEYQRVQEIIAGTGIVQSVTGDLVDNTDPKNPVINERKDLPEDFFVSCVTSDYDPITEEFISQIMYITDTYRFLPIETLVPQISSNCASVHIQGNNIYLLYYVVSPSSSTPQQPFGVLALKDCSIVNNELVVGSTDSVVLEGVIYEGLNPRLHCEGYHDGYLYFATRVNSTSIATQFVKVNTFNLSDYQIYSPFNGGGLTNIQVYKNYIYCLPVFSSVGSAWITRINTNFLEPAEQIVEVGTDISRQIRRQFPFTIYLDEIYIFTTDGNIANPEYNTSLGVEVYSMSGELKRAAYDLEIAPLSTSPLVPHWFDIFNNKIIFHTATTSTASIDGRKVVKIDCGFGTDNSSIILEDSISLPDFTGIITDDNSIMRSGEIYLNSESSDFANRKLFYIPDYRDFSTVINVTPDINSERIQEVGYSAAGSTPTYVPKESLQISTEGFIPLDGTETGSPITGDLEFTVVNGAGTNYFANTDNTNHRFLFNGTSDAINIISREIINTSNNGVVEVKSESVTIGVNTTTTAVSLKVTSTGNYVELDAPLTSRGLIGLKDFTANITDLDYVQKKYVDDAVSGGGGATNLSYTPSPTGGSVNSDTGTDATIPLADTTNAGLLSPSDKTKLNAFSGTIDATPTDGSTNAVQSNGVFDSLALKENVISGTGYVYWNGTTKTWVSGNANAVVLGNATTENKNTLVNGATLSVLSTSNVPIAAGDTYLVVANKLQGQISAITGNMLTGSATLNFGSTPAGESSELTIAVTGAADGDVVALGIPNSASLANTCYTARVSAANTVSVKFNNYSSVAADPGSGTFKVRVFK